MKEFLITKTMTTRLLVRCDDEIQAQGWARRIVASLEDENGMTIQPSTEVDFEASSSPSDCRVELLD